MESVHGMLGLLCFMCGHAAAYFSPNISECEEGSLYIEGSCYHAVLNKLHWTAANAACESHFPNSSAVLATVANHRVNALLEELIVLTKNGSEMDRDLWIGLNRINNSGQYRWEEPDAIAPYRSWIDYSTFIEPSYVESVGGKEEECAAIFHRPAEAFLKNFIGQNVQFSWTDRSCDLELGYICKYRPSGNRYNCKKALVEGEYSASVVSSNNAQQYGGQSSVMYAGLDSAWAWQTTDTDSQDYYIQVTFSSVRWVVEVLTQGLVDPVGGDAWTTAYRISYTKDGATWTDYSKVDADTDPTILVGNTDGSTVKHNILQQPFAALAVRIYPMGMKVYATHYALRFELLGCRSESPWSDSDQMLGKSATNFFRVNNYLLESRRQSIYGQLSYTMDGNDTTCSSILEVSREQGHIAWPTRADLQTQIMSKRKKVVVKGNNIPCQQSHFYNSVKTINKSPLISYALNGGVFQHCTLMGQVKDEAEDFGPIECSYLCSREDQAFTTVIFEIFEPHSDPQWQVCSIEVYELE